MAGGIHATADIPAGAFGSRRILAFCNRVASTGTLRFFGGTTNPIELLVVYIGKGPGGTAIEL
jgi:hypothetical protein